MKSYKEQKLKYFDEAIRLYYEEGLNYKSISRIIPPDRTTIKRWIYNFAVENNINPSRLKEMGKIKTTAEKSIDLLKMEAEITQLKAEKVRLESDLKFAEIKADAYNEMINVAETMFKIPIRKKAGAKR